MFNGWLGSLLLVFFIDYCKALSFVLFCSFTLHFLREKTRTRINAKKTQVL